MDDNNEKEKTKENLENNKKKKQISLKSFILICIIVVVFVVGIILSTITKKLSCYYSHRTGIMQQPIDKPIIYLYPQEATEISINLGNPEKITCTYPDYKNGWHVIANPDGTLIDTNTGRKLYSLYWEGVQNETVDLEEGFVVAGKDSIKFLEEKLAILGLNEVESEEFIIYWLPKLQENKYNYIRFATMDEINKIMPLEFSVEPDTLIRILMQYKALDNYIEVDEQILETPERTGFVALEWGGTEIK